MAGRYVVLSVCLRVSALLTECVSLLPGSGIPPASLHTCGVTFTAGTLLPPGLVHTRTSRPFAGRVLASVLCLLSSSLLPGPGPRRLGRPSHCRPATPGASVRRLGLVPRVLDRDQPLPPAKGPSRCGDSASDMGAVVSMATLSSLMVCREPLISLSRPEAARGGPAVGIAAVTPTCGGSCPCCGLALWGGQGLLPPPAGPTGCSPGRAREARSPPAPRGVGSRKGHQSFCAVRNQWQGEKTGKFLLNASNLQGCVVQ